MAKISKSKKALLWLSIPMILLPLAFASTGKATATGNNIIVHRAFYENPYYTVQMITQLTDLYICHINQGWKAQSIHNLRPSLKTLLYRDIRAVKENLTEVQAFLNNGWILKNATGTLIKSTDYGYYIVDVGNPAYQTWLANWVKNSINQYGFDGIYLDDMLPSTEIMWNTAPRPAINPRTGNPYTALEFEQAVINIVNTIKNAIGNKLVLGNMVYFGQRFFDPLYNQYYKALFSDSKIDGVQSEAWIMALNPVAWYSEAKWLGSINYLIWLENNFLNKGGKMFLPLAQNAAPVAYSTAALPSGATREQYVNYAFSSLLLGISTNSTYLNFGYATDNYTQSLFNIDIGSPMGSYYIVNGTHLYARDYSKVKIVVNPTNTTYTINLAGYQNLNGTPLASPLVMQPYSGGIFPIDVSSGGTILQSGFESGDFRDWDGTYTTPESVATVATNPVYSGTFGAKFTSINGSSFARAFSYKSLSGITEVNVSMRVNIDSGLLLGSGDALWLIQFRDSTGFALASYGIKGYQTSTKWASMVNSTNSYATSGPALDTWYWIEAYYSKSSSGTTVLLNINHQQVAVLILGSSNANNAASVRIGICYNAPGYASNIYVDDVTITSG